MTKLYASVMSQGVVDVLSEYGSADRIFLIMIVGAAVANRGRSPAGLLYGDKISSCSILRNNFAGFVNT